jgi:hypothetical protein
MILVCKEILKLHVFFEGRSWHRTRTSIGRLLFYSFKATNGSGPLVGVSGLVWKAQTRYNTRELMGSSTYELDFVF